MARTRVLALLAALLMVRAWDSNARAADAPASPAAPKPNIIFFLVDDLGWRDVGYTGSRFYETPHIDKLAATGLRFTQAYANCAVCSPSRSAIMTGKYPARLHITDYIPGEGDKPNGAVKIPVWQKSLPTTEISLATALKKAGYATAIAGKWHLGNGESRPEHHGFDVSIAVNNGGQPGSYFPPYGDKGPLKVPGLDEDGVGHPDAYLTDRLTEESQKFIVKHHADHPDQPFFLYLAHYAVHAPLMAKKDLTAKYAAKTPVDAQKNPVYAAMIDSTDQSMGAILSTLDQLHLRDNTIIIFTGDNGGVSHTTSNAPLRAGKGFPYEGGTREATFISWPGHIAPGDCATPIIGMDFYPTLLRLAGAPLDHPVDGVDLSPLWLDAATADAPIRTRDALFWHYPHYWGGKVAPVTPFSAVRQGDWKLIHFYEDQHDELYNLKSDPSEAIDLAKQQPEQAEKLRTRLDAWLKDVAAQIPERKKP